MTRLGSASATLQLLLRGRITLQLSDLIHDQVVRWAKWWEARGDLNDMPCRLTQHIPGEHTQMVKNPRKGSRLRTSTPCTLPETTRRCGLW